jgi:hypothetical protein
VAADLRIPRSDVEISAGVLDHLSGDRFYRLFGPLDGPHFRRCQNRKLTVFRETANFTQIYAENFASAPQGKVDLAVDNMPFADQVSQHVVTLVVEEEKVRRGKLGRFWRIHLEMERQIILVVKNTRGNRHRKLRGMDYESIGVEPELFDRFQKIWLIHRDPTLLRLICAAILFIRMTEAMHENMT